MKEHVSGKWSQLPRESPARCMPGLPSERCLSTNMSSGYHDMHNQDIKPESYW
jgi:hypothetical protein